MSWTEDGVKAKLKSLNETQESIVTVSQWVMFHRRYADKTAQIWLQRLSEANPQQRVNLVYLANEVAQQSKGRRKEEFVNAFAAVLPDAIATAMKGASSDTQTKIRRVVEVWRQRQVFDTSVQTAIEARVAEMTKQSASSSQSSVSQSVPSNLQPLVATQSSLSKAQLKLHQVSTAQKEYKSLMSTSGPLEPGALERLVKTIANAEMAVSEVLDKRREIIAGLERLLNDNRAALNEEESSRADIATLREEVDSKALAIQSAVAKSPPSDRTTSQATTDEGEEDIARPEMERFTPPPVEALTPPPAPLPRNAPDPIAATAPTVPLAQADLQVRSTTPEGMPSQDTLASYNSPPVVAAASTSSSASAAAALAAIPPAHQPINGKQSPDGYGRSPGGSPTKHLGPGAGIKRRKTSDDDFDRIGFGAAGQGRDVMDGLDEDVVGMLG